MVELAADPCRVSELVAESIEAARAWYEFRHQKMAVWRDGGVHLIEPKDFSFRGGKAPTAN
ncbi:MAG: hypothetical protein SH850_04470 [Planctomycetaceae bacterium]|nr:hypothetical protein [Planctomycetaceae bacterium]